MTRREIAEAVADRLLAAHAQGYGLRAKPDAPFSTLEFFLVYSHEITRVLRERGLRWRPSYHAETIRINTDALVQAGEVYFTINRRYTKTEIRKELVRQYRDRHALPADKRLPKGAGRQIEQQVSEFMTQMYAILAEQGR